MQFGKYIRNLRLEQKATLRKVATALDIDVSTLSKIEKGEREALVKLVPEISKIFSVPLKEVEIEFLYHNIEKNYSSLVYLGDALKISAKRLHNNK